MADTAPQDDSSGETNNEETPSPVLEDQNPNHKDEAEDKNFECTEEYDDILCTQLPSLEELVSSVFVHNRLLATKKILEAFQKAGNNQEELQSVVALMCKLSEDDEAMVRSELVQQIPSIAVFCFHHSDELRMVIRQQLVPYVVKLMNDSQLAVCKLGQSALIMLLESHLIDDSQLSEWICPYVAQLAVCANLEELRIEDVTLMSKMAPLVGKDMAVKFFVEPFLTLCSDPKMMIRKVCATNIGTFCKIVGTEITETSFLPYFVLLCRDFSCGVRKACADVFVEVAQSVSPRIRRIILPLIMLKLLDDNTPYVKTAAVQSLGGFISTFAGTDQFSEEAGSLSSTNNESMSEEIISQTVEYVQNFTSKESQIDSSEEVGKDENDKVADDDNKKSLLETSRTLVYLPKSKIFRCKKRFGDLISFEKSKPSVEIEVAKPIQQDLSNTIEPDFKSTQLDTESSTQHLDVAVEGDPVHLHVDSENVFNNFQFWRTPLPEIELESVMEGAEVANVHIPARVQENHMLSQRCTSKFELRFASEEAAKAEWLSKECDLSKMQVKTACINTFFGHSNKESVQELRSEIAKSCQEAVLPYTEDDTTSVPDSMCTTSMSSTEKSSARVMTPYDQNIVPAELLVKYISSVNVDVGVEMKTDTPVSKVTIEERIAYCAYSFPAVVSTLGKEYWPCIKDVCDILAGDIKWTIRRTIASSLHELAFILGHDITVNDLIPIFKDLMMDMEEIRLRLIQHFPDFLNCLYPEERYQFLPLLEEFAAIDNERNWRFRCAIAEQFQPMLRLFSSLQVCLYFLPIAFVLIQDKVSSVRSKTVKLMAAIIKKFCIDDQKSHIISLVHHLDSTLTKSKKWMWRQTFVFFCEEVAVQKSLSKEMYIEEIAPRLYNLAYDDVPNVRLAVARSLSRTLLPCDVLYDLDYWNCENLKQVIYFLQQDKDNDVKHYAQSCYLRPSIQSKDKEVPPV